MRQAPSLVSGEQMAGLREVRGPLMSVGVVEYRRPRDLDSRLCHALQQQAKGKVIMVMVGRAQVSGGPKPSHLRNL